MADSQQFAEDLSAAIKRYRTLLEEFVRGQVSADEFQTRYFEIYLNDNDLQCSDDIFDVVDGFFAEVDAYVDNPKIRDVAAGDLGPHELKARAKALLDRADG